MMNYQIEKTSKTPHICFANGVLDIEGRSIPENPVNFYEELIELIRQYKNKPLEKTVVNIHLDYINSSSNRTLVKLLSHFEDIYKGGHDVIINWRYDKQDEIIYEQGKDFMELIKVPFHLEVFHDD